MSKRTTLLAIAAIALLVACHSTAVSTQIDLQIQIDSGKALNSSNGNYRAGAANVALTKIVSLPGNQFGLRFVISAPALNGRCCGVFPRIAMVGESSGTPDGGTYDIYVAENRTSISSDNTLDLRLFGGQPVRLLGSFKVSLSALGAGG